MGVCPWCLTKDFSINFLFFSLTCICIVYSLKAYYDLWSNPLFYGHLLNTDTSL